MSGPRLFVALPLPESARSGLARSAERLAARTKAGRPRLAPADQMHLTLRFFGVGPDPEQMEERLRAVLPSGPAPRLRLKGLGAFPSSRRARIVFAAVAEVGGELLPRLRTACEHAARDAGLAAETRRFVPHVTLLRLRRPVSLQPELLAEAAQGLPSGPLRVPEARLIASALTPTGAVHRVAARFRLEA